MIDFFNYGYSIDQATFWRSGDNTFSQRRSTAKRTFVFLLHRKLRSVRNFDQFNGESECFSCQGVVHVYDNIFFCDLCDHCPS